MFSFFATEANSIKNTKRNEQKTFVSRQDFANYPFALSHFADYQRSSAAGHCMSTVTLSDKNVSLSDDDAAVLHTLPVQYAVRLIPFHSHHPVSPLHLHAPWDQTGAVRDGRMIVVTRLDD